MIEKGLPSLAGKLRVGSVNGLVSWFVEYRGMVRWVDEIG